MGSEVVLRIRPSTADDYDALWNLHVASMRPSVEATWGWDEAFQADHFRAHFVPGEPQVIELDGRPVGVFVVRDDPTEVFVRIIEIHPVHQGRGLGTSLLRLIIRDANRRGVPVALEVLKANRRAQGLYRRLGFKVTKRMPLRYRMTRQRGPLIESS